MITCEKAAQICDKAQYNEATLFEKLKLNLHLFICKACTKHAKKNSSNGHKFGMR
jgi:predicted metal-binding protein